MPALAQRARLSLLISIDRRFLWLARLRLPCERVREGQEPPSGGIEVAAPEGFDLRL